jgi:hypothetical protein
MNVRRFIRKTDADRTVTGRTHTEGREQTDERHDARRAGIGDSTNSLPWYGRSKGDALSSLVGRRPASACRRVREQQLSVGKHGAPCLVIRNCNGSVNTSSHVWILREAVDALKGMNKLPELAAALRQSDPSAAQPYVYARVFPDSSMRHDWRRVKLPAGKQLAARIDVLVSANPEEGVTPSADAAPYSRT